MGRLSKSFNSFSNILNHPWEVPTQTKFSLEAQKRKKEKKIRINFVQ
jgi:hypothetical protein